MNVKRSPNTGAKPGLPSWQARLGPVSVFLAVVVLVLTPGVAAARPKPKHSAPAPPPAIVAAAAVPVVDVFTAPGAAAPTLQLSNPNHYRGQLVLLVKALRTDGWLQVLLPVRPNGSTGWIHAGDVVLSNDPYRVVVQLRAHRVVAYRGATTVLSVPAGIGKASTPTPGGGYYLTQLFQTPNPDGAYGPYAYSLSGFSEVLTTFKGGDAIIGLHGTNQPQLVGTDVSSGCIRVRNDAITKLAHLLPLGTPVTIVT